jgi:hypothetical protein
MKDIKSNQIIYSLPITDNFKITIIIRYISRLNNLENGKLFFPYFHSVFHYFIGFIHLEYSFPRNVFILCEI